MAEPAAPVVTDPFTSALGELVKELMAAQTSGSAAPSSGDTTPKRWGEGNPKHPNYRARVPLSGPEGDSIEAPEGKPGYQQYVELPGMRLPSMTDLAERPLHHLRGAAQNAFMGVGYTGNDAAMAGPIMRAAEMVAAKVPPRLTAGLGASAAETLGSRGAHAEELPPPPGWGGDDKALQVDIGRRPLQRPTVGAGEYGMPDIGPLPQRDQGEIRSTNPAADWWVDKGMPPEVADPLMKFGKATGDTAADIAGRPMMNWGARKIDALSTDVARMAEDAPSFVSPAEAQTRPGQETPEEIMKIQREMQAAGKYFGPIDGQRGNGTNQAIKAWAAEAPARAAAEAAKRQQDIEAGKNTAAQAQAAAAKEEAEAKKAETLRLEQAAAKQRDDRALGERALTASDKNVPVWQQVLRNDGEALGWALGGAAGHMIRSGVPMAKRLFGSEPGIVGRSNAQSRQTADEVNSIIDGIKNKDWHARVGDVNEVWRRGQPAPLTSFGRQPELPFASAPGSPPWSANPTAPPISDLYRPNRLLNLSQDIGIPAAGAIESGVMHYTMREPAEHELAAAQKAYDDNPNSANNIQRLQEARTAVGTAKMAEFFGRGTALGYTGSSIAHRRAQSQPNLSAAESERGRINEWLNRSKGTPDGGGRGAPPGGPGPAPSPSAAPSAPRAAAPAPEPSQSAPAPALRARPSPATTSSSSSDLPEHLDLTPWGVREKGSGRFASNPTAQSTASSMPAKGERNVKATRTPKERPQMDEAGNYVKPPLPPVDDLSPYGRGQ